MISSPFVTFFSRSPWDCAAPRSSLPVLLKFLMGWSMAPLLLTASVAHAADRVTVSYGPLARSISIASLRTYAKEGKVTGELRAYTRYLDEQQLAELRRILLVEADLDPVTVSQFLYTDQGTILLRKLGEVVRTESNQSGFLALRSALVLAAADGDGLSVVNILEEFPLNGMRINLNRAFRIVSDLETLIRQTQDATDLIAQQSQLEAANGSWINFAELPDLRQPGRFAWDRRTLILTDRRRFEGGFSRDRTFLTDVYLPSGTDTAVQPAPVIVISHGLGSDRSTYAYLAQHLASYGFVVAVPEHPGSNAQQIQDLLIGAASKVTTPEEFINRPLDIKFLLDHLQRLAQTDADWAGRMDLQQVGIVGQSMGGYTALALAGAKINFQQLTADCRSDTLNLSLLLQCRAVGLSGSLPSLKDDRVKSVIAINPIGSSLLGRADFEQIQVPVMIVGGTADTIAPVLLEQIRPFTWLKSANRYLVLLERGTHFSTIDVPQPTDGSVQLPRDLVGPNPAIAHTYLNAIGTAFFKTYLTDQPDYRRYLEAAYTRRISQTQLPLLLVQSLTPAQLAKVFRDQPLAPVEPNNSWLGSQQLPTRMEPRSNLN